MCGAFTFTGWESDPCWNTRHFLCEAHRGVYKVPDVKTTKHANSDDKAKKPGKPDDETKTPLKADEKTKKHDQETKDSDQSGRKIYKNPTMLLEYTFIKSYKKYNPIMRAIISKQIGLH